MLLVKTTVAPSAIEGLGLFAAEHIPKGTITWEFNPEFDREFRVESISALPNVVQDWIRRYAYKDQYSGTYILSVDNDRHTNHSSTPNTKAVDTPDRKVNQVIALRDIEEGEEITADYHEFDTAYNEKNL